MGAAIVFMFFLPWLDRNPSKSIRYRETIFKLSLYVFIASFLSLGWLGTQPATRLLSELAYRFSELYFTFFLFLWIYSQQRSKKYYLTWLVILLAALTVLDVLRGNEEKMVMMIKTWLIPGITYIVLLWGSTMFRGLIQAKPVPERVTH